MSGTLIVLLLSVALVILAIANVMIFLARQRMPAVVRRLDARGGRSASAARRPREPEPQFDEPPSLPARGGDEDDLREAAAGRRGFPALDEASLAPRPSAPRRRPSPRAPGIDPFTDTSGEEPGIYPDPDDEDGDYRPAAVPGGFEIPSLSGISPERSGGRGGAEGARRSRPPAVEPPSVAPPAPARAPEPDALVAVLFLLAAQLGPIGQVAIDSPNADEAIEGLQAAGRRLRGPVRALAADAEDPFVAELLDASRELMLVEERRSAGRLRRTVVGLLEEAVEQPELLTGVSETGSRAAWNELNTASAEAVESAAGTYLHLIDGLSRMLSGGAGPDEAEHLATLRSRAKVASVAPLEMLRVNDRVLRAVPAPAELDPRAILPFLELLAEGLSALSGIESRDQAVHLDLPDAEEIKRHSEAPAVARFLAGAHRGPAALPSVAQPSAPPAVPNLEPAPAPPDLSPAPESDTSRRELSQAIVDAVRHWVSIAESTRALSSMPTLDGDPEFGQVTSQAAAVVGALEDLSADLSRRAPELVAELRASEEPRTSFADLMSGYRQIAGARDGRHLALGAATLEAVSTRARDTSGPLRRWVDRYR